MTSFIPIFAILMMVMMNHSTDSGAVSKSNPRQNVEMRKSRSFAKSKTKRSKKYTFLAKNYQKSAERDKMTARNNEMGKIDTNFLTMRENRQFGMYKIPEPSYSNKDLMNPYHINNMNYFFYSSIRTPVSWIVRINFVSP